MKCGDGRTILPDAFKDQDGTVVPLVWQHNHDEPENVLGHVLLKNKSDGVYGYGFFNETDRLSTPRLWFSTRTSIRSPFMRIS
jgi:hypothetical protein